MKKKISLLGIGLGLIAGGLVALLAGSWIFWLASDLPLAYIGSAGARREAFRRYADANSRAAM